MSHLLTGYEQFSMNYFLSHLPKGSVVATIHDGWINRVELPETTLRRLEAGLLTHSAKVLKIPLDLKLKGTSFAEDDPYDF